MSFALRDLTRRLAAHPHGRIIEQVVHGDRQKSFAELAVDVDRAVDRLRRTGVLAGMRVGFLADNCYEWIVYDLALIECRCVAVALVREVLEGNLEQIAHHYGMHAMIIAKSEPVVPSPRPAWVLCFDEPGSQCELRHEPIAADPDYEVPSWVFSSGSSGRRRCIETDRKGIEALVASLAAFVEPGDRFVMFLPMSNFQQRFLLYGALWFGIDIVITDPLLLLVSLKKHRPTLILAPPIFYDAIANRVSQLRGWRGLVLRGAMRLLAGLHRVGWHRPLARLLSRPIREALGGRARMMITGMAPTSRRTLDMFDVLELPLFEAYGMTECGLIARNTTEHRRLGSVGMPIPNVTVSIARDGEVQVHVPHPAARRYPFDEQASRETFVAPGQVATGDIGHFDADGYLYLRGRKNNVIVLSSGTKIHPELVESQLEGCPEMAHGVVFPDGAGGLLALLSLKEESPLAQQEARKFVAQMNRRAPPDQWIGRMVCTHIAFTPDNGLLTPNLKLNRAAIARRFGRELAHLTLPEESTHVEPTRQEDQSGRAHDNA